MFSYIYSFFVSPTETPKPQSAYFCALRILPKKDEEDLGEYMTLAFLGKHDEEPRIIENKVTNKPKFPKSCVIVGEDMFGAKNGIPVWKVGFESKEDYEACESFWKVFNVKQEHTEDFPSFHVSKKGGEGRRKLGERLVFTHFFEKKVEGDKPYFEYPLQE